MKKNYFELLYRVALFFISPLLFASLSCNDNPTTHDDIKPGRRDYTWTVDTLYSPNNTLYSIWGAAPDDVWLGGPGGITNYDRLWHYDGMKWEPYKKQILMVSPECIWGFNKNDVWLGGNDGKIWHYDGNNWQESFRFETGSNYVFIVDISGDSPSSIYAIGVSKLTDSFVLKYNGTNWHRQYYETNNSQFFKLEQGSNGTFIAGLKQNPTGGDTIIFYEYTEGQLEIIYSNSEDKITSANINKIGDEVYFLIGRDLNRYINNKFVKVVSFSEPAFGYQVYGRSTKDFFVMMKDGLAHYNGTNLEYLVQYSNQFSRNLKTRLLFDEEVFFPVHDFINNYNLVFHGKLKE